MLREVAKSVEWFASSTVYRFKFDKTSGSEDKLMVNFNKELKLIENQSDGSIIQ